MINNYTKMKLKQKIYNHANYLTWNTSLLIVTLFILFNNWGTNPVLYIFPALFAISIFLVFISNNAVKILLNIIGYIIILVIVSLAFTQPLNVDTSGLLSSIWFGILMANVFLTLTLTYIIKTTINRHFLVLKTTITNLLLVLLSGYLYTLTSEITNEQLINFLIGSIFTVFIITTIITTIILLFNNRSYYFSPTSKKLLSTKHRTLKKEKTNDIADMEKTFVNKVYNTTKNTGFTFKVFTASNRLQGYLYKNDMTFVLLPIDIIAHLNTNNKNIFKSTRIRRKSFDKIIYSIINRYSGVNAIPSVPIVLTIIIMNNGIKDTFVHTVKTGETDIDVNFVPIGVFDKWIKDVNNGNSNVVFPVLEDKKKDKRENDKNMTLVDDDYFDN